MSVSLSWTAALAVFAIAIAGGQALAQKAAAPYAGSQGRAINSLSRDQIVQLTKGEGMGLALAAELNGYPGSRHVLDLGNQLGLTDEQRARVLGQKFIAAERELNAAFADRTIAPERLQLATAGIGELQGRLRVTHLKYHLATAALLTPDQIHRYTELRGYTAVASAPDGLGSPHSAIGGPMPHHIMGAMPTANNEPTNRGDEKGGRQR